MLDAKAVGVDASVDASMVVDANTANDAEPAADAFDCSPNRRLSINILNPGGSSGDVLVRLGGILRTTCRSDDETCYVCISPGEAVSLDPIPSTNSVFTTWNQCGSMCSGGVTADPCSFTMPSANVGCLANFAVQ